VSQNRRSKRWDAERPFPKTVAIAAQDSNLHPKNPVLGVEGERVRELPKILLLPQKDFFPHLPNNIL
jgi:hypothetical protein